jgi:peptidyl-dipeptidase Dcp
VRVEHFRPALEAAMAENLAEVERIANNPEAPTFQNTIEALERAGETLERVRTVYGIWSSNLNSPEFQTVEREMAPRLAWYYRNNFVRAGARLDAAAKARLSEINQRLAGLFTRFSQNVLAAE